MNTWLHQHADGSISLRLHVQPGAKTTGFVGPHGEAMKLRLAAPPVDGKANAALCLFLADFCKLPRTAVSVIGGETSRSKRLRIVGASAEAIGRLVALG